MAFDSRNMIAGSGSSGQPATRYELVSRVQQCAHTRYTHRHANYTRRQRWRGHPGHRHKFRHFYHSTDHNTVNSLITSSYTSSKFMIITSFFIYMIIIIYLYDDHFLLLSRYFRPVTRSMVTKYRNNKSGEKPVTVIIV